MKPHFSSFSCNSIQLKISNSTVLPHLPAYGTAICDFYLDQPETVDWHSFEFNGLVGSYLSDDSSSSIQNREWVSVRVVHSLLIAKHLGVERLKSLRRYFEQYGSPFAPFCRESLETFLKQTTDAALNESKILMTFDDEYDLPMFQYRMQMIALCEQDTNWRVLQASAHCDIESSIWLYFGNTLESKPEVVSLLYYWANIAQDVQELLITREFLDAVVETVRTFLA